MNTGNVLNAIKGLGGEPESIRTLGLFGGAVYVIGTNAFVAWEIALGRGFDLSAYCTVFPLGLGGILGSIAGAVSWKDKGTASARVTQQTGAVPVAPTTGPQVETTAMPDAGQPPADA